jgi:collagenase-like PrtC family protease
MTRTRFTVACNWDPALIKGLGRVARHIKYIFGKTRMDVFSGGRADCEVADGMIERKAAKGYIRRAKDFGLEFSYLLNGTELHDEFSRETTQRIRADLEWIAGTGAGWVTVSNPRIAEIIKDSYPLKIDVSIFAHIRTPLQAKRWAELGARSATLDRQLVHDIEEVRAITGAVEMDFALLANDPCLLHCERELYHDRLMCRASVSGENYFHYCSFACLKRFIKNPSEIVRSTFIRPEDIALYEDAGIRCFKIVDRNRTTPFILNAVKAYVSREYNGNLLDIFSLFSSFDRPHAKARRLNEKDLSVETIDRFWNELPSLLELRVDNIKMSGYARQMAAAKCHSRACHGCTVCQRRVHYNKRNAAIASRNIELIMRKLNNEGL